MRRLVLALILVAACGGSTPIPTHNPVQETEAWRGQVEEVTLSDGTRCAVLSGANGRGGIDCDWKEG